jgi:hypothetical protein
LSVFGYLADVLVVMVACAVVATTKKTEILICVSWVLLLLRMWKEKTKVRYQDCHGIKRKNVVSVVPN